MQAKRQINAILFTAALSTPALWADSTPAVGSLSVHVVHASTLKPLLVSGEVTSFSGYTRPFTTDSNGNARIDVQTGLWTVTNIPGYVIRSQPNQALVKGTAADDVLEAPTKISPKPAQKAARQTIFLLVSSVSEEQQLEAEQAAACPDSAAVPSSGSFNGMSLKICSQPGARVALYSLPPAGSSLSVRYLTEAKPDAAGECRLLLDGVSQSPFDRFAVSSVKEAYIPASISFSRLELAGMLAAGKGVALPLSAREGMFEEPGAPPNHEEPARRLAFAPRLMEALPVPGIRAFDYFANFAPGVFAAPQTGSLRGPGISPGTGTAGEFSVNGMRARSNNFNLDGSDNNDEEFGIRRQGFVLPATQSIEAQQEFQLLTALADARFGRELGGQFDTLAKAGSAQIHGTVYGFLTDSRVNARGYFDEGASALPGSTIRRDGTLVSFFSPAQGKTPFTQTQSGIAGTGPLGLAESFFSAAFEGDRIRSTAQQHFAVPRVEQRGLVNRGLTGFADGAGTQIYPASLPGNALFSLFPFPNDPLGPFGGNTYTALTPSPQEGVLYSLKGEKTIHILGRRNLAAARYSESHESGTLPSTGGALFSTLHPHVDALNAVVFFTTELSPKWTNSFRTSFGKTRMGFIRPQDPVLVSSSLFPRDSYLLNAPLLLNLTTPASADGVAHYASSLGAAGRAAIARLGIPGFPDPIPGTEFLTGPLGQIVLPGFSSVGVDPSHFPRGAGNETWQWNESTTWIGRRLIVTGGLDVRRIVLDSMAEQNVRPRAVFNGLERAPAPRNIASLIRFPGDVFYPADMAAAGLQSGMFQTLTNSADYSLSLHKTEADYFVQGRLRMGSSLSLSLGLRLEAAYLPEDVSHGLLQGFDVQTLQTQVANTSRNPGCSSQCRAILNALASQLPADFNTTFGADRLRADPRLGFAWNIPRFPKLTARGGFGVYTGQFPAIILSETRNLFPESLTLNFAGPLNSQLQPAFLWNPANPSTVSPSSGLLPVIARNTLNVISPQTPVGSHTPIANAVELLGLDRSQLRDISPGVILPQPSAGLRNPTAFQYGLTLEYALNRSWSASVAFVGTSGRHLLRVSTPSLGPNRGSLDFEQSSRIGGSYPLLIATPLPAGAGPVVSPLAFSRTVLEGTANSTYNSLQIETKRRWMSGLQLGGALTYAHAIDDVSDYFSLAGAPELPQNSRVRSERASANFDARLRVALHGAWEIFEKRKWGDWQLAGVYIAQTGQPYTVNSSIDVNEDGNLTDRLNTTSGLLIDPPGGGRRTSLSLAPGADPLALLAKPGQDGAIGRNTFRAPGFIDLNVVAGKRLRLGESASVVARVEVYNLLNRANFGIPVRILEAPSFGSSVNTTTPGRTIQLALKFSL